MRQDAKQTEKTLSALLETWGGALTRLQIDMPDEKALDGGILCPCCGMIHGRCHEAVYPLLTLAERTGDRTYLTAAKKLFRWGENMLCPDGSVRNDAKSDWRGVTAFAAIALHDALFYHGSLLTKDEKDAWETRLRRMGEWLYANLRPQKTQAYLNYYAATACATALLGRYFQNSSYLRFAAGLASFCINLTTQNLLVYGEGHPLGARTAKGCFAIDAGGYNAEETLPALTRCALALGDKRMRFRCIALWEENLKWMLPDGAWDDSAGSRAFKWTYWGSRTTDGCQDALFALGRETPVFAEAALRNTSLLARCTHDGLLYGGPDYHKNGEKPCVHHTFCHAKALAGSLNGGLYDFERVSLPAETAPPIDRHPELDALHISLRPWIAVVSGYDHFIMPGAHASGGAISLLWHEKAGPLIACGAADYRIREPFNQQLPSDRARHRSPCPRLEIETERARYGQHYDPAAAIHTEQTENGVTVTADAHFCDDGGQRREDFGACRLEYRFTADALRVCGEVDPARAGDARYILPLVGDKAAVAVQRGTLLEQTEFFNLNPGFRGTQYTILPDEEGVFALSITVSDS